MTIFEALERRRHKFGKPGIADESSYVKHSTPKSR